MGIFLALDAGEGRPILSRHRDTDNAIGRAMTAIYRTTGDVDANTDRHLTTT
jgi:hypothetical protein